MHPLADFQDMLELKQANTAAGQYWFTEGAMRFFNCRLSSSAIKFFGVAFFVSSEKGPPIDGKTFPRLYTARMMPLEGDGRGRVHELPGTVFQQFRTSRAAWAAIDAYCATHAP